MCFLNLHLKNQLKNITSVKLNCANIFGNLTKEINIALHNRQLKY